MDEAAGAPPAFLSVRCFLARGRVALLLALLAATTPAGAPQHQAGCDERTTDSTEPVPTNVTISPLAPAPPSRSVRAYSHPNDILPPGRNSPPYQQVSGKTYAAQCEFGHMTAWSCVRDDGSHVKS